MEGLVILIAELLVALLAPAFAVLGAVLAALAELVTGLVALVRRGRTVPSATPPRPPRRWPCRLLHGAAALGAVAGVAVLTVNLFFLDPALRWTLARVEARTGYAVDYAMAQGNLFTGRLAMTGVTVARGGPPGLTLDVAVEAASVDVAMLSLIGQVTLQDLTVAGVTGRIATPPRPDTASHPEPAPRPRRDFTVDRARIERVDLEVAPADGRPHRVEIASAEVAPFRSRSALFDLLFRSNLDARIAGVPLSVTTEEVSDQGRRTSWRFEEVPIDALTALTDRAPVRWLSGGTVSARVEDRWDLSGDEADIDMDWSIAFDGVGAAAPEGAGAGERMLATALARALARRDGDAEVAFTLTLDRGGLVAAGSDDLTALWDALRDGLAGAISARVDATADGVRDGIDGARDRLFDYLDRRGRAAGGTD